MSSLSSSNGSRIQDGTVAGMFEFLDNYLIAKGYLPPSTVSPWKSAAKQVIETVEKTEQIDDVQMRGLDTDDYLRRYETLARGQIKEESIQTYRRRFTSAHDSYVDFIEAGKLPTVRAAASRRRNGGDAAAPTKGPKATNPTAEPAGGTERMIEYPFPLRNGQVGMVRLPMRLEKTDAERLASFVRTLVFEPQLELGPGRDDPDEGEEE
jgi:hypothetical protein